MKFALTAFSIAAIALAAAQPAYAATTVNVDGITNASLDGSNGVNVNLAAGKYSLSFIQDAYTAFNRFSSSNGCDLGGEHCTTGWENSARYILGGSTYYFGDGAASGGMGPLAVGNGYFSTAAQSFANAAAYSTSFTLTNAGVVTFFIYDDQLRDNTGGASLSIAAVPEPATWALMILGFGAIGGMMRRQRVTAAVRYA